MLANVFLCKIISEIKLPHHAIIIVGKPKLIFTFYKTKKIILDFPNPLFPRLTVPRQVFSLSSCLHCILSSVFPSFSRIVHFYPFFALSLRGKPFSLKEFSFLLKENSFSLWEFFFSLKANYFGCWGFHFPCWGNAFSCKASRFSLREYSFSLKGFSFFPGKIIFP